MDQAISFHGFGTDKDFNAYQLRTFVDAFQDIQIDFVNGPIQFPKSETEEILQTYLKTDYAYGWVPHPLPKNQSIQESTQATFKGLKTLLESKSYDIFIGHC